MDHIYLNLDCGTSIELGKPGADDPNPAFVKTILELYQMIHGGIFVFTTPEGDHIGVPTSRITSVRSQGNIPSSE